jgi:uncharacterized FAD-dependent dehydrogenase
MTTGKDKEDYYVLSNGETHEVDQLIIGMGEKGITEIKKVLSKFGLNLKD